MEHREILKEAARILTERGEEYGAPEECFDRIANIASEILMRRVSRYEVAVILGSTKLGRAGESALKDDTWIDEINYFAFAAQFAKDPDSPPMKRKGPAKVPFTIPTKAPGPKPIPLPRGDFEAAVDRAFADLDASGE